MPEAVALKQWLAEQDPPLANEIFLDVDPSTGIGTGVRWKEALRRANARCEAVICLLSSNWEASQECRVEYRTAENLNKQIFVARLEPSTGDDLTSEWQRCDLFGDGPRTRIEVGIGSVVEFSTEGLFRLRDGIRGAGIGAESFVWPPPGDVSRAPYRGWEPLQESDAAVFFGRDAQIVRALDSLRGMRLSAVNSLFVVLGPSGTGKSSFLRAGLLPRLRREDRRFVVMDIIRPDRDVLTGSSGLAASICATREMYGLPQPALGDIKAACAAGDVAAVAGWLDELRQAATDRLVERGGQDASTAPTLVLPLDQAEELFTADTGAHSERFLQLLAGLVDRLNSAESALLVTATIRTDRYEVMQTHPALAGTGTVLFDELKPLPPTQFKEVIVGPASRSTEAGRVLSVSPDLVERLLADASGGADTLPMLALTLSRLYTDYGGTGELTLGHYEALGWMRRVVQTEIDEVLSTDPERRAAELEALRATFIPWLATVNPDNDQPMRRVARYADLPEAGRPLIDALVAKRLMVKDTRDGQTVVEVALESLLRQWDELAGWLREQRHDLKQADDLERAAAAWNANQRDAAWLLEGSRLSEAGKLADTPGFRQRLTATHEFLAASHEREAQRREAEEQQRQAELLAAQERQATAEAHAGALRKRSRVLRAVLAVTAVVAVIAVAATFVANNARGQAQQRFEEATGIRLVSEAQGMLDGNRPGGDVRAMQQLLVAEKLTGAADSDAMYDAAVREAALDKVAASTAGWLYSPVFSPDGNIVAAGGGDGAVWLWDAHTGQPHGEPLQGGDSVVEAIAFSPDGSRLASADNDGIIRFWDVADGAEVGATVDVGEAVTSVTFSSDGGRILTTAADVVQMWDVASGEPSGPGATNGVEVIALSPDRTRMAVSYENGVGLYDLTQNAPPIWKSTDAHTDRVVSLAYSPDGTRFASASVDGTVRLWDGVVGGPLGDPLKGHTSEVVAVDFHPDGQVLASAGGDGTVRFWDAHTGAPVGSPIVGSFGVVTGLSFSPDGSRLAAVGSDGLLRVFDMSMALPLPGRTVAYGPDGTLAVGLVDGTVQLWRSNPLEPFGPPLAGHRDQVNYLVFSPDGKQVASGGADGAVWFWDIATGTASGAPIQAGDVAVTTMEFSQDGRYLTTGLLDGNIQVWDSASHRAHTGVFQGAGGARAAGISEDGTQVTALIAYDDGAHLVQWDIETGKVTADVRFGAVTSVAGHFESKTLALGSFDGSVDFLNTETGEKLGTKTKGHDGAVSALAFRWDGERAVSADRDGTVRLWDPRTADTIGRPLTGPHDVVLSVALSPDGQRVVAGAVNDNVWQWPASGTAEDLCAKLTANMSHRQWDEWVSPDIDYVEACPGVPVASDEATTS